jgi:recombination protein RecA
MSSVTDILSAIGQKGAIAASRPPLLITPTRLPGFNAEVLGTGGLAGGRVYELYAPPSAGKSTLAQIICADYQRQGKIAAYIDAEATTQTETSLEERKSWMQNLGVNLDELIMPNFGSAEECFELVFKMIVAGANIIVIDTVAVLQPMGLIVREEQEAKMNERMILPKALTGFFNGLVGGFSVRSAKDKFIPIPDSRLSWLRSHGVTVTNPSIHKLWYYDCAIIGVNHAKTMIGVLYGDPTYTPGGASLGFHSSIRFGMTAPVKSKEKVKIGDYEVPLFRKTRVVAAKNKLANPFGEISLRVYQDGRVAEDIPFFVAAEKQGLVSTTARSVTVLVGDHAGLTMKKVEFENWVAENPDFLNQIDSEVEVEEAPSAKISFSLPEKKEPLSTDTAKFSLGQIKQNISESQSLKLSLTGIKGGSNESS